MAYCMTPLFINTTDLAGGAARAAYRLFKGVRSSGLDARMLVRDKTSNDVNIVTPAKNMKCLTERIKPHIERLPFRLYPHRKKTAFHFQWNPGVSPSVIQKINPDIIHLHWICGGFLRIESLPKLKRPIVWTLHDMWAFTGGCNYSADCNSYEKSCGHCPQLASSKGDDLSRWVWRRKKRSWAGMPLAIVAPSRWLAECAGRSSLFHDKQTKVIPNGIDTDIFRPCEKKRARERFNLPQDKTLILFSAANGIRNPLKGFDYLRHALNNLKMRMIAKTPELVIMGNSTSERIEDVEVPVHNIGHLTDEHDIALLYSAADLFAAPSVQDNLPNTVMEAFACGTPCVAFRIGGLPDMIEHQENGYLAEPFDAEDLAHGIAWSLENQGRRHRLSSRATEKVISEFAVGLISKRYMALYEELCSYNTSLI